MILYSFLPDTIHITQAQNTKIIKHIPQHTRISTQALATHHTSISPAEQTPIKRHTRKSHPQPQVSYSQYNWLVYKSEVLPRH